AGKSQHAEACRPDPKHRSRRLGVGEIEAAGKQGNRGHPRYGSGQRNVIDAAAVVKLATDGPVGDIGTGGVECTGAEQLSKNVSPPAHSGVGKNVKRDQEHELFGQIREVEIGAVSRFIALYGLPGDQGVYINENPPDEQEGKVEHSDAF